MGKKRPPHSRFPAELSLTDNLLKDGFWRLYFCAICGERGLRILCRYFVIAKSSSTNMMLCCEALRMARVFLFWGKRDEHTPILGVRDWHLTAGLGRYPEITGRSDEGLNKKVD